jgi:hypothetical protein
MTELTASVISHGDPGVGIYGYNIEVPLGVEDFLDDEERESVRETLRDMYTSLWDDNANVTFSDEWTESGFPKKI